MKLKSGMLCWIDQPGELKHGFIVTLGKYAGVRTFIKRDGSKILGRCWEVIPPVPTWRRPEQPRVREVLLRPINPPSKLAQLTTHAKELEIT